VRARHTVLAAVLAIVAVQWLAGCSSREQRRDAHVSRAEEYLAENKSSEALIELRNALKLDPQNGPLNYRIGEVFEKTNRLGDALFFYEEALRLSPQDSRAALSTARLEIFTHPDRAETLINEVITREPGNAMAYIRRSELELSRAKTDDALAAALTANELDPKSHMALFQVGVVHRARIRERLLRKEPEDPKIFEAALAAFDAGLAVAAKDAPLQEVVRGWTERALVLASWKEREADAGPAFQKAAAVCRERGSAVEEQRVLGDMGTYARATRNEPLERWALERRIELDPRAIAAWSRLVELSDDDAVLERLLETLPDTPDAHVLYANSIAKRGRGEEAFTHLRDTAGRISDPVPLQHALASLLLDADRIDEARAIEQKLVAEQPTRPETYDLTGLLAMQERRFADAAAATRKLVERQETPRAQLRIGEAEYRLGNYDAALAAVNRAIELAGEAGPQRSMLRLKGRIENSAGDPDAASQTFRRLRRAGDGSFASRDVAPVARALYASGRDDAAREVLSAALGKDDPPFAASLLYLQHESNNNPTGAREVLERALKQKPFHPALIRYQVTFAMRDGKTEAAEQIVTEAIAVKPESAELQRLHAEVLVANKKPEEALAAAERAMAIDPELRGVVELFVNLLGHLGRQQVAIDRLEAEASKGSLSVSNRLLLARLHIITGTNARAIELLESVIAERSNLSGAKNDLAFLLAQDGADLDRALRLAQEARAELPRSTQVADTLGYVYLKRNLPEAAIEQFLTAIDLAKAQSADWATAQYHLGLGLKALGRPADARAAFERALASSVQFPEADETRREIEGLTNAPAGPS
jgi:tetratricopeptide (TPR) repeat protein